MMERDAKEWFEVYGNDFVRVEGLGPTKIIGIEALYQVFKKRLVSELIVDAPGLQSYGLLEERKDDDR